MERHLLITDVETSATRAVIQYDLPDSMTAYEERLVTIKLSRGLDAGQVLAAPTLSIDPDNVKLIRTTDSVSVRLVGGRAFSIVASREATKSLSLHANDTGEWDFFITPQEGGAKNLILEVSSGGDASETMLAHLTKTVTVAVPMMTRVWEMLDGWPKELMLLFVAGVLSILVASWYERRTRKPEPANLAAAEAGEHAAAGGGPQPPPAAT